MTGPLGTADFFALEAGDYLDRLETLVTRADGPDPVELLRMARALRGSALMANQPQIARAAAGLEALARAHREGRRQWDTVVRERGAQAVEEFRLLVRRARDWSDTDTQRATQLGTGLEELAGGALGERGWVPRTSPPGELNPGVRAFVAREGALIASAIDRAARAFEADPENREPLYGVLRRMQSLRGLAELADLSPLPEILDGVEHAIGDLTRLFAPPPGVVQVFDAGAQALTRVSRDVADDGRPAPDTEEARRFTDFLLRAFAVERDVVPVEALFVDGDREPIRRSATEPPFTPPAPLGAVELVSHGEHLSQTADVLARARSLTERDLRLYGLVAALRALSIGAPDGMEDGLRAFAESARAAIADGTAAADLPAFATLLREAGSLLRVGADAPRRIEAGRGLAALAARLAGASEPVAAEPSAGEAVAAEPATTVSVAGESAVAAAADIEAIVPEAMVPEAIVPIESLAIAGEPLIVRRGDAGPAEIVHGPVVPIESLVPAFAPGAMTIEPQPDLAGEVVDVAALVAVPEAEAVPEPGPQPEATPLEASFDAYARLVREHGLGEPSLAVLLTAPSALPDGGAPAPAAARVPASTPAQAEVDVVDIMTLCYDARGALARAVDVRDLIAAQLVPAGDLAGVRPLLEELLDLVPLAAAGV